jgi:hypothetical protein
VLPGHGACFCYLSVVQDCAACVLILAKTEIIIARIVITSVYVGRLFVADQYMHIGYRCYKLSILSIDKMRLLRRWKLIDGSTFIFFSNILSTVPILSFFEVEKTLLYLRSSLFIAV